MMTGREGGTATFIGLRTIFRRLRPSCRFGFEEGMKCPKCRRRRRIRQLHDNDGGGTGSKDAAACVRVDDDAKGRLFPVEWYTRTFGQICWTCMLQGGDSLRGSAKREITAKNLLQLHFFSANLDLQLALRGLLHLLIRELPLALPTDTSRAVHSLTHCRQHEASSDLNHLIALLCCIELLMCRRRRRHRRLHP